MSLAVLVRSPIRCRWWALRFCSGLSSGPISSISSGTPISTTRPSVTEVDSRITETSRNETIAPANRALTSITLADVDEVVGADRDDLAGGDLAGQGAAEVDGLAADELDGAVGRGQPVGHREPVPHDAAGRLDQADQRASRRPTSAARRCPWRRRRGRSRGRCTAGITACVLIQMMPKSMPDEQGAPLAPAPSTTGTPRATGGPAYRGGRGGVGALLPRYGADALRPHPVFGRVRASVVVARRPHRQRDEQGDEHDGDRPA